MFPKFSIITNSYNRRTLAEQCIRSVLGQSYTNLEYFVIDNGSKTPLTDLINVLNDSRVIFSRHEENQDSNYLVQEAFNRATGDYLLWLQDDDALTPSALKKVADYVTSNAKPDILLGGYVRYNHDTGAVYPEQGSCSKDGRSEPWQENANEILGTIGAFFGLSLGPSKTFTIPASPTTSFYSMNLLSRVSARQSPLWIPPFGDHSLTMALLYTDTVHILPAILGLVGDTTIRDQTSGRHDRHAPMKWKSYQNAKYLYNGFSFPNCQATSVLRAYACHRPVTAVYKILRPAFYIRHASAILNDVCVNKQTIRDLMEVVPDAIRSAVHFGLSGSEARDLAGLIRRFGARCGGSALKRRITGPRLIPVEPHNGSDSNGQASIKRRFSSILECATWLESLNPPAHWRSPLPD